MTKPMPSQGDDTIFRYRQLMCQDKAFKLAMLAARKAGLERVVLGVIVDNSPIPPSYTRYDVAPAVMVSQSVAGELVDMGRRY